MVPCLRDKVRQKLINISSLQLTWSRGDTLSLQNAHKNGYPTACLLLPFKISRKVSYNKVFTLNKAGKGALHWSTNRNTCRRLATFYFAHEGNQLQA